MPDPRDVVITGVGVVSPIGIGFEEFWTALLRGDSGIRPFDGQLGIVDSVGFGGQLVDFDPKAYVRPRKALKVMSREIQIAFSASVMAIEHANLDAQRIAPERIGTVFGSEMMSGEPEELADAMAECGVATGKARAADFGGAAMRKMYPLWMLKYLPNMAACHIGITLGALGPNNSLVTGDTSAPAAVIESVSVLRRGAADCVITGASGTRISPTRLLYRSGFAIPTRRDPVSCSSRPMARDRDGVVGGEAGATMMLETAAHAEARGTRPLVIIAGSAVRFRATADSRAGSTVAIESATRAALADAGLTPSEIGAVISHAMGDVEMDAAEARAIECIVGPDCPVVAPIAAVGHTGAASGAVAIAAAVGTLMTATVPPTKNAEQRDPALRVNLLAASQRLTRPAVLVLSHTPQGHAVALVLRSAD